MNKQIQKIKQKVIPVFKKNKVEKAGIFGSYARGEENNKSDVDILIKINRSIGLFQIIKMKLELEKKLNRKVDLVEYNNIHPLIKKIALKEEIRIL